MGLDFITIRSEAKKNYTEVYPDFDIIFTKDLMVKGNHLYAVWDEGHKQWLTDKDEIKIISLIDQETKEAADKLAKEYGCDVKPLYLRRNSSKKIREWHQFVNGDHPDIYVPLNHKFIFDNEEPKRENYSTICLPYHLEDKPTPAYDELAHTLYSEEELQKIEWCIGAILSGDSKKIQKFLIITGDAGSGKSTMLNIIQQLFEGYYISFNSRLITDGGNFGLAQFKDNPLVAIEHDGNLSKIIDNSRMNSLISHEEVVIEEKYRAPYVMKFDTFLIMASNSNVEITDAKSGLTRRIIDVEPTGKKVENERYLQLMSQIKFELGGIAQHCLNVYEANKHMYDKYRPERQISRTYKFYDFIDYVYSDFVDMDEVTLDYAWNKYKKYVEMADIKYSYDRIRFKNELQDFFREFHKRKMIDGVHKSNVYVGFIQDRLLSKKVIANDTDIPSWLKLDKLESSIFDRELEECQAQYATEDGVPMYAWDNVQTRLKGIKSSKLHYVRPPENLVVVDFDIRGKDGEKSLKDNLKAASSFPPTYAETSQSGNGLHLHYFYDGDINKLSAIYAPNVEVKIFKGKSALRRRLSECNNLPVVHISSGLPLKEGGDYKKMVNKEVVQNEREIRNIILRALKKEYEPHATAPMICLIEKVLKEAFDGGIVYDVSDLYSAVRDFAMQSTHQAQFCIKKVSKMKFKSAEENEDRANYDEDAPIIFFDVEVFPNVFIVCYKVKGKGEVVKLINPDPEEVRKLFDYRLVGFNNRNYDNHIMYAWAYGGYSNRQLYSMSKSIINGVQGVQLNEARNASYADVYEYSSKKQSLKKWEIELGIYHLENQYPWDEDLPEEHWEEVATYCANDVIATEKVAEAIHQDFVAREILAKLSGLTVNHTTRQHTTKIIFGDVKNPELVYTDLSKEFPGYSFDPVAHKSSYMGEDPSEGGYVYAEPGIYENVILLDVASLHPHSIIALNLFGEYTPRFKDILDARIAIKHKDYAKARKMLDGALAEFLDDEEQAAQLAQALKIVINSVYGFTTATFPNPFKDERNIDNIVAKRGALFMISLKHKVQEMGYTVAHVKTDSIKIPDGDDKVIKFCMDYAKKYGYTFEHEATYEKFCLVNDAVYIAKYADGKHKFKLPTGQKIETEWTATGTQFQVPYVFKTLFAKEPIIFDDMCETKSVTSALYLDFNEQLPEDEHNYHFVGRVGQFTPVIPGVGGGILLREKDGKYSAATGTKGYRWLESRLLKESGHEDYVDISYYASFVDAAKASIEEYGNFEEFVQ